jgi:cyclic-di-GMP phosphodiesterase TipF (flagellum assembly factor)
VRGVNPAPKPQHPTAPPPLSPAQAYTAAVADALVAGRVDVEIEPIVSLIDQRTRHYEVSVHVRGSAEERLVENNAFASLRGTGLSPLFDSARLQRSIGIAQRLVERAKDGRVFSIYSAESLTHAGFLSDVRAALRDSGIGGQIVFAFDQSEIRNFAAAEWAALAELRQMQAVLAIDNVSHLDLDLKRLIAAGFGFARVPAADFISGLRFGGKPVQGADLQRYVAGIGLTLIAGHVDDEQQLQRIAALGAPFGQGKVFGGRRQVKLTTLRSSHAAA